MRRLLSFPLVGARNHGCGRAGEGVMIRLMYSDPLMKRLDAALRAIPRAAALPFIAWAVDSYGHRIAERVGYDWAVHDALEVIRQRSLGQEPDIGAYSELWANRLAGVQLTPQQLRLFNMCASTLCDHVRAASLAVVDAYKLSGLNAEPVIQAMLQRLR